MTGNITARSWRASTLMREILAAGASRIERKAMEISEEIDDWYSAALDQFVKSGGAGVSQTSAHEWHDRMRKNLEMALECAREAVKYGETK